MTRTLSSTATVTSSHIPRRASDFYKALFVEACGCHRDTKSAQDPNASRNPPCFSLLQKPLLRLRPLSCDLQSGRNQPNVQHHRRD